MSAPIVTVDYEAIKADLSELVRKTVEDALNALLAQEADDLIGAEREAYRAGHYDRGLTTTSDEVVIHMPKFKGMRFATAIIERYKRRETSVEEAMIEMYLAGVSTRRIEDAFGRRPVGLHLGRNRRGRPSEVGGDPPSAEPRVRAPLDRGPLGLVQSEALPSSRHGCSLLSGGSPLGPRPRKGTLHA